MKKNKKTIILCLLAVIVYIASLFTLGYENKTIKNKKNHIELTTKPRLEDDYYDHVNYDVLSKLIINEEDLTDTWSALMTSATDEIKSEKKQIIEDIIANCSTYDINSNKGKLCKVYETISNVNYEENKNEFQKYIDLINSSNNIGEYLTNISEITNIFPESNILFSLSYSYENDNYQQAYPSIDPMYYDYTYESKYFHQAYAMNYPKERMYLKRTNLQLLMEYGYKEEQAREIVNNIYKMFDNISKYASIEIDTTNLKSYTIDELKPKYPNINFDLIKQNMINILGIDDKLIITDESQLKLINEYLIEDNLSTLKEYAIIRLLHSYGKTIDPKYSEIIYELEKNLKGTIENVESKTILEEYIYNYFNDTISLEFARKYNLASTKVFYEELTKRFLDEYKIRIQNELWLSPETKNNAIKKIDMMKFYILYPEESECKENLYNIEGNSFYEVTKSLALSNNKIIYNSLKMNNLIMINNDWLVVNAFYSPTENSIVIGEGIVYSIHKSLNITNENLMDNYYKILGSAGYVIGHEISHAFDNFGSKYNEYGKKIDWWTEKDKLEYNKLTLKVEKYYEKYNQEGYQTLGENIADLGSYSIIMQIANTNNATNDNYKEIFESTAQIWASQNTAFIDGYLLMFDEHSPNKNRVNAVLSSTDKFYEIYNIKKTDKMFVEKEDRVAVW